jgi:hypothetical protein
VKSQHPAKLALTLPTAAATVRMAVFQKPISSKL